MAACLKLVTGSSGQALYMNVGDPSTCAGPVVLSAEDYNNWQAQAVAFGWNAEAFGIAFIGALLLFSIGLTIGLVMSQVRKARI